MILGASAIAQIVQALAFISLGVLSCAVWLLFEQIPMIRALRVLADLVLCLALSASFLFVVQTLNRGEILMFQPISLLAGFFMTWKVLPRLLPKLAPPIADKRFYSKRTKMRRENPNAVIEDYLIIKFLKTLSHNIIKWVNAVKTKKTNLKTIYDDSERILNDSTKTQFPVNSTIDLRIEKKERPPKNTKTSKSDSTKKSNTITKNNMVKAHKQIDSSKNNNSSSKSPNSDLRRKTHSNKKTLCVKKLI